MSRKSKKRAKVESPLKSSRPVAGVSETQAEGEMLQRLRSERGTGNPIPGALRTDERVLARVSDGIYRKPASALRELIANAYDADATEVHVRMEPPVFGRIAVEDNGNGMSEDTLVNMIHHIGGSAKRTSRGVNLHITDPTDPTKSPGGRRLIGKIGIGLFSVAQLTRSFTILTKQRDTDYRLVAEVTLHHYSDDSPTDDIQTGAVVLQSVKAKRAEHGTTIILTDIQPAARAILRSKNRWEQIMSDDPNASGRVQVHVPRFHCGRLNPTDDTTIRHTSQYPWSHSDDPNVKFQKLAKAIQAIRMEQPRPRLSIILDEYLKTLWELALALPLGYIDGKHPFDLPASDLPDVYRLTAQRGQQAVRVEMHPDETLRQCLEMHAASPLHFKVFIDDVELLRPLRYSKNTWPGEGERLLFVGKAKPDVSKLPVTVSGGRDLDFEAIFLWTPTVAPIEHVGVMVRIADASGTGFDREYFGYQTAEIRRLQQLSGEVFVRKGLEGALNIDRESFNFGHPHAKIMADWTHNILRQFATTHKALSSERLRKTRESAALQIDASVGKLLKKVAGTVVDPLDISDSDDTIMNLRQEDVVVLDQRNIEAWVAGLLKDNRGRKGQRETARWQLLAAIGRVLYEYDTLNHLSNTDLENMFGALMGCIELYSEEI